MIHLWGTLRTHEQSLKMMKSVWIWFATPPSRDLPAPEEMESEMVCLDGSTLTPMIGNVRVCSVVPVYVGVRVPPPPPSTTTTQTMYVARNISEITPLNLYRK